MPLQFGDRSCPGFPVSGGKQMSVLLLLLLFLFFTLGRCIIIIIKLWRAASGSGIRCQSVAGPVDQLTLLKLLLELQETDLQYQSLSVLCLIQLVE